MTDLSLAIISDCHLGDPACGLVEKRNGAYELGWKFEDFEAAARRGLEEGESNDYLVLLGDVFEFAITNYADAYAAARAFLEAVERNSIAEEVIYVPGNHWAKELLSDVGIGLAKRWLKSILEVKGSRWAPDFFNRKHVIERLQTYYRASEGEIRALNEILEYGSPNPISLPTRIISGHTHQRIPWECRDYRQRVTGTQVTVHNAGGWLSKKNQQGRQVWEGAEVFLVRGDQEITSVSV